MNPLFVIAPIVVALVSVVLYIFVYLLVRKERIQERDREIAKASLAGTTATAKKAQQTRVKALGGLESLVEQAGFTMGATRYLLWTTAVAVVIGLAVGTFTNVLAALVCGVAVYIAAWLLLRIRTQRRAASFDEQLGQSLPMVATNIRSGQTFESAVRIVSSYMEDPLRSQFKILALERQMGVTLEQATANLANRVGSRSAADLAAVISIQQETGGSIADVLDSIAHSIQQRNKQRRRVKAITADGRVSAVVVGSIPIVVAIALTVLTPGYFANLLTTVPGRIALAVAVVMLVSGLLVIRKLYKIDIY